MTSQTGNQGIETQAEELRFGIMYPPAFPWPQMVEGAQLIESLGFDSLWLPDHFVNPGDPTTDWFECWTVLAALATQTESIRIGTLITSMIFRNPALVARQALTVDHISGGRLELGIGAGGSRHCHTMTGIPVWEPRERVDRFRDFAAIVDRLMQNEVTTYEGAYYRVDEAQIHPAPVQRPRPPLTIAAQGPKMLEIVATYADSWSDFYVGADLSPQQSSEIARQRNEKLDELAAQAGRDPQAIWRSFAFGWTADNPFRSLDDFQEVVGRYREAGMNEFIFMYAPGVTEFANRAFTSREQLQRIAAEALPAIKEAP